MDNFFQPGQATPAPGESEFPVPLIDATSPSMRAVVTVIRELAHNSVPVLLIGEHGTGKQSIAQQIHRNSEGPDENFYVKTCRDLTPEFLTPSAGSAKATLYLDEVGDPSAPCQKELSEFLAKQGTNGSARMAARVICGSSRDLEADVRAGSFREDLYYRLSGVCLRIPPLRQRREDVPHLMTFFLARYSESFRRPIPPLSPETQQLFRDYAWPGNLHELEAAARAIVAVGDESVAMGG